MAQCLECGKDFNRKHPKQKFCSPVRGQRICKDKFHNRNQHNYGQMTQARCDYLEERGYAVPDHHGNIDNTHPHSSEALGQS